MRRTISAPRPDLAPIPDWESYEALAREVLNYLADGDHPDCVPLREQVRVATIRELNYSGAGFFLSFDLPEDTPRLSRSGEISDVQLETDTGADPIGVVLFVRDGRIVELEVFGYANWPTDIGPYRCRYIRWQKTSETGATAEPTSVRDFRSFWGAAAGEGGDGA